MKNIRTCIHNDMCTHHCTLVKTHRLIDRNKCATLVRGVNTGCVDGAREHMGNLYLPLNFIVNLKLLFKQSIFEKVPESYIGRFLFYLHIYAFWIYYSAHILITYVIKKNTKDQKRKKHYQSIHTVHSASPSPVSGRMWTCSELSDHQ